MTAVAVAAFASTFLVSAAPASATGDKPGTCREISVSVALSEGGPTDNTVATTLCTPSTWAPGEHRIDVLVAGATYNRTYWDWPQGQQTYSYVDHTLAAGRATFSFDRLGTGSSSRPASSALTVSSGAYVLHQLIGWLRGQGYAQVNGVGHSLGSVTLTNEASRWHDLDRLVATGIIHLPGVGLNSTGFFTSLYPAALDPEFAGKGLDPGYLTTMPGRRGPAFYDPNTVDPTVIAYDESNKDLTTVGEVSESSTLLLAPAPLNSSRSITAPVLVVMGATDDIFCNLLVSCKTAESIRANEAPFYSGSADFDTLVVPGTAHNLPLHPSASSSFQKIDEWIKTGTV
ncbi:alpha/beta hydrolase [Nocardia sp. KC 131]|uniref:alpha/beta hydrolase n=1 Tax=Nocardia arseniciresistens TaxID=3392119 RepID=UPI00398F1E7C